jgi:hypothetical protein
MRIEVAPETSVIFNQLTCLIYQKILLMLVAVNILNRTSLFRFRPSAVEEVGTENRLW